MLGDLAGRGAHPRHRRERPARPAPAARGWRARAAARARAPSCARSARPSAARLRGRGRRACAIVDYRDADALAARGGGLRRARSTSSASSRRRAPTATTDAHERAAEALADAAAKAGLRRDRVRQHPRARARTRANACLASKGRAEAILLAGAVPALILRVPMVLGPGDPASRRCARQARAGRVRLVRGGATLEQPIAARRPGRRDRRRARPPGARRASALDLAGPESLSHRELVQRAARVLGTRGRDRAGAARAGRGVRVAARSGCWPSRRSRPRCSACSSTTTRSTRARVRAARHPAHAARRDAAARAAPGRGGRDDRATAGRRAARRASCRLWQRALPWLVTFVCFTYLYIQIDRQAARQGQTALGATSRRVFAQRATGLRWLALMIPYSAFFFLIDSLVVWRVVSWFNARVSLREHPADPRLRLHPLDPERAGRQGRDGALPEPPRRRAGLAGRARACSSSCSASSTTCSRGRTLGACAPLGARCRPVFHRDPAGRARRASSSSRSGSLYFRGALAPGSTLRERQIFHAFRAGAPLAVRGGHRCCARRRCSRRSSSTRTRCASSASRRASATCSATCR